LSLEQKQSSWTDELYRLGVPTLSDYVEYVRKRCPATVPFDEGALIDQWRRAWRRLQSLEDEEAGYADSVAITELPAAMAVLLDKVLAERHFRQAFASLPISFGMVELDRLAVFQSAITLEHSRLLANQLDGQPDEAGVFRFCLPFDQPAPLVKMVRNGRNRFVFQSPDMNLRFLGAESLDREMCAGLAAEGPLAAGLGVKVGFGSSYLNVVRMGPRMVLNNGYHRAYALRSLGITHAPCVIQVISHADELAYAGGSELIDQHAALFASRRPPVFKDFFDDHLTTILKVQRTRTQLQINIDVQTIKVPW
jgi:hypothetical protein